jgi:hypothetical protein
VEIVEKTSDETDIIGASTIIKNICIYYYALITKIEKTNEK